jgi:hypothetical protein
VLALTASVLLLAEEAADAIRSARRNRNDPRDDRSTEEFVR